MIGPTTGITGCDPCGIILWYFVGFDVWPCPKSFGKVYSPNTGGELRVGKPLNFVINLSPSDLVDGHIPLEAWIQLELDKPLDDNFEMKLERLSCPFRELHGYLYILGEADRLIAVVIDEVVHVAC